MKKELPLNIEKLLQKTILLVLIDLTRSHFIIP